VRQSISTPLSKTAELSDTVRRRSGCPHPM